ncbi:hypothetical protein K435DRAFT_681343, partial [Dendrothele bispora CBS 962.96]
KKERQWKRWLKEVIPSLVEPYMEMLRETQDLRLDAQRHLVEPCSCNGAYYREISQSTKFGTAIEKLKIWFCGICSPTTPQLVRSGLFPCAPLAPTLAVDIRMLDFVNRLFLRVSPNITAWCGALEDFLRQQGHWLQGQDPLRRRFGNCVLWFTSLQDAVCTHTKTVLEDVRSERLRPTVPEPESDGHATDNYQGVDPVPVADPARKRKLSNLPKPSRASAYLRSRCALCFGSTSSPELADVAEAGPRIIVMLDACFTHKHRDQRGRDPPRLHPDTMFVPEEEVKEWETKVKNARPSKVQSETQDDHFEHGMRVPKSALDVCLGSFQAAHETLAKALALGYDNTADAALLCPHDACLFMVAMDSPGERQHFMLALIGALFKHIPDDWTVGILYDVGCQTQRSCLKWGFLKEYLHRITWGISVFHAYGHNWACQLIYHPRKCQGFGLCDGEGCERCWSSLSHLVAYTRVVGYYLRLYTLDTQLHHHNAQALSSAGQWLRRKTRQCNVRRLQAESDLRESGQEISFLKSQWDDQVKYQTQPLPRQKKNAAKAAVQEALRLNNALDTLEAKISDLEAVILSRASEQYQTVAAHDELQKARQSRDEMRKRLFDKEKALGITEKRQLRNLKNDAFLTKRLNARALKERLRQKLISRKFEYARLKRSYRKQKTGMYKSIYSYHEKRVDRSENVLSTLATKYNTLCDEMAVLVAKRKAPKNALVPRKIDKASLFDLDVDEEIWQDFGLGDDKDEEVPPPWMADERVREGIRAMLELDRCQEERARLRMQRRALQEWFVEEWQILTTALDRTKDNVGLLHQLELRKGYLLRLCVTWEQSLVETSTDCSPFWGPSTGELAQARRDLLLDAVVGDGEQEDDDFDGVYLVEADIALTAQLDTQDIADGYRRRESEES